MLLVVCRVWVFVRCGLFVAVVCVGVCWLLLVVDVCRRVLLWLLSVVRCVLLVVCWSLRFVCSLCLVCLLYRVCWSLVVAWCLLGGVHG